MHVAGTCVCLKPCAMLCSCRGQCSVTEKKLVTARYVSLLGSGLYCVHVSSNWSLSYSVCQCTSLPSHVLASTQPDTTQLYHEVYLSMSYALLAKTTCMCVNEWSLFFFLMIQSTCFGLAWCLRQTWTYEVLIKLGLSPC